jgi:hypothetical protein
MNIVEGLDNSLLMELKKMDNPYPLLTIDSYFKKLTIICKELCSARHIKKESCIRCKTPKSQTQKKGSAK